MLLWLMIRTGVVGVCLMLVSIDSQLQHQVPGQHCLTQGGPGAVHVQLISSTTLSMHCKEAMMNALRLSVTYLCNTRCHCMLVWSAQGAPTGLCQLTSVVVPSTISTCKLPPAQVTVLIYICVRLLPAVHKHCAQLCHQSVTVFQDQPQVPCRLSQRSNGFTERFLPCHGFSASRAPTLRPHLACIYIPWHHNWSSRTAMSTTTPYPTCISHLLHAALVRLIEAIRLVLLRFIATERVNRQIQACAEAFSGAQKLKKM